MKKTLVIGASENPERYSNKAIRALLRYGHHVVAIGLKNGNVEGISFHTSQIPLEGIDTVTLYIGAQHQPSYYDYILKLSPKRVIFNPGTENPEFIEKLKTAGIDTEIACTLVLLSLGQF